MYGKAMLIRIIKEEFPQTSDYSDDSFRYLKINYNRLRWFPKEFQECLFLQSDRVDDFGSMLARKLSSLYVEARHFTQLTFSNSLSHDVTLDGTFFDHTSDGDDIFVSWVHKSNIGWIAGHLS